MSENNMVYVVSHKLTKVGGDPVKYDSHVAKVVDSIETFEEIKDESWNGKCNWRLSQDTIGMAGLNFRTYSMDLEEEKEMNRGSTYLVSIRGFEIEKCKKNFQIINAFNYNRYERRFKVGEKVKITIRDYNKKYAESFWIEITEAKGYVPRVENKENGFIREEAFETHFKGRIDNELLLANYPKLNEIIEFNIGNIINVWDNSYFKLEKKEE